MITTVLEPLVF